MTISITAIVDAPLDRVWAIVSDFRNLKRWHPLVERCETAGEGEGAVRMIWFADSWASERLDRLDQNSHVVGYSIIDASNPSSVGIRGSISLAGDGPSDTSLTWSSGLDASHPAAAAVDAYLASYYPLRVGHLRAALGLPEARSP